MARSVRPLPASYSPAWPVAPCTDEVAEVARLFALALSAAMGETSLRGTAAATGVDRVSIKRILDGEVWPDMVTIARLERGLRSDLWPGRHTESPAST